QNQQAKVDAQHQQQLFIPRLVEELERHRVLTSFNRVLISLEATTNCAYNLNTSRNWKRINGENTDCR
ncbi:hypothetical protein, partial [Vibrio vulnificus]|uniref:hypothetical protein n=1 Tax=Vibrio vulnificus TaxID=672 RepID=UPI001C658B54